MAVPGPRARQPSNPLVVFTDFNETLVLERTLLAWSLDRLRSGSPGARLASALRILPLGALSLAADRMGAETLAAAIGFRVFAGVPLAALEVWARQRLTPNPRAYQALARLAAESAGGISLVPLSRGTPGAVVRAYLARPDVRERLAEAQVTIGSEGLLPELELSAGVCTGRLEQQATAKAARLALVPEGAVFLGDRRDARFAERVSGGRFRFVRV